MNYIGIDVHKSICTAVVMNDDEKVIDQIIDFGTNDEGCSFIVDRYSPEDSYILFENLTTAHRVYHFFKDRGYRAEGLHTGHGCVTEISKTDFKTDLEDATKLARMCKDHFTGRREYALAHSIQDLYITAEPYPTTELRSYPMDSKESVRSKTSILPPDSIIATAMGP